MANKEAPRVKGGAIKERILRLIDEISDIEITRTAYSFEDFQCHEKRKQKKINEINELLDFILSHYPE
jgi:hypothetical protein